MDTSLISNARVTAREIGKAHKQHTSAATANSLLLDEVKHMKKHHLLKSVPKPSAGSGWPF